MLNDHLYERARYLIRLPNAVNRYKYSTLRKPGEQWLSLAFVERKAFAHGVWAVISPLMHRSTAFRADIRLCRWLTDGIGGSATFTHTTLGDSVEHN